MIPRFSVYLDPNEMNGYIREDVVGQWVRWLDAMDYIAYARAHGFVPPSTDVTLTEVVTEPSRPEHMVDDDLLPEELLEEDDLSFDGHIDLYDLMMGKRQDD